MIPLLAFASACTTEDPAPRDTGESPVDSGGATDTSRADTGDSGSGETGSGDTDTTETGTGDTGTNDSADTDTGIGALGFESTWGGAACPPAAPFAVTDTTWSWALQNGSPSAYTWKAMGDDTWYGQPVVRVMISETYIEVSESWNTRFTCTADGLGLAGYERNYIQHAHGDSTDLTCDPPVLLLPAAPAVGDTWTSTCRWHEETDHDGMDGSPPIVEETSVTVAGEVVAFEPVETPSGTYDAWHVSLSVDSEPLFGDVWYAEGVGPVRIGDLALLSAFTPG